MAEKTRAALKAQMATGTVLNAAKLEDLVDSFINKIDDPEPQDGYTPQKGVDYFDGYTPVKGTDYFDGEDGADGKTLLLGTVAPAAGLGAIGDSYLNQTTWDYSEKTGASIWTLRGNIKGAAGADGNDGNDGVTPNIGVNKNWWINGVDTGIRAEGVDAPVVDPTPQILTYSTTPTLDYTTKANASITLTGNATTFTISNVPDGGSGMLEVRQNATGGYGINAIAHVGLTIIYQNGKVPTSENIHSGANEVITIGYYRSGTNLHIVFAAKETGTELLPPQTVTYSSTPTQDVDNGKDAVITLTGNVTEYTLANVTDAMEGYIDVIQGGSGSYEVAKVTHAGLTTRYVDDKAPVVANMNTAVGTHTALFYKRFGTTLMLRVEKITAKQAASNLVHQWSQNDVGTIMVDSVGNVDGTDIGTVVHGTGVDEGFRIYNGTDAGTNLNSIPSIFNVGLTNPFTFTGLVKITTKGSDLPFFHCNVNTTTNWFIMMIDIEAGVPRFHAQINASGTKISFTDLAVISTAGDVYRLTITWDGTNFEFYVNATKVTNVFGFSAVDGLVTGFGIANAAGIGIFTNCKVGEMEIYNKVLSDIEIGDL